MCVCVGGGEGGGGMSEMPELLPTYEVFGVNTFISTFFLFLHKKKKKKTKKKKKKKKEMWHF